MTPKPAKPLDTPTESGLHEAALRHLARYGTTVAGLVRVLDRRVLRWARDSAAEPETIAGLRETARQVAARLAASGVVDDAAFAETRARSLARSGRSRRAIAAHLAARGTEAPALGPGQELAAAAITLRRRRLGPFGAGEGDPLRDPMRELGVLARAGFAQDVARAALALSRAEAEALIAAARE